MYIIVRTDKKYSAGKIMVHIAHNSLSCILDFNISCSDIINDWYTEDQTKIILSVKDLDKLLFYYKKARESGCPAIYIEDMGFYEVPVGEIIACAILCTDEEAIEIGLKNLRLYKGENIK